MKKAMSIKNRLISAVLVLVMTFTSLIGTTFAWFTDTVTSVGNTIESGTLKVDLLHKDGDGWISLKENEDHLVFDYKKWEPGFTLVETLKVQNLGSLALKYKLSIEVEAGTAKLGKNGENLADVIDVWVYYGETSVSGYGAITAADSGWVKKGTLSEVFNKPGEFMNGNLLPTGKVSTDANVGVGDQIVNIALHMQESAGNEYQKLSAGNIYVNLIATQLTSESDSFGSDYDTDAIFPELNISGIYADVVVEDGKVAESVSITGIGVKADIPEGVVVESNNTSKVGLSVIEKEASDANITLNDGEALRSLDVHIAGISKDNTIPMYITVEQAMKTGLNIGNYTLYHVEDGVTVAMTAVNSIADLDVHNEFYYDPATGDVTLAMATFSEVAFVAEPSKWEGNRDYYWYTGAVATVDDEGNTVYTIANADQLAGFSAIVGNMAEGIEQDSFSGKTVKLIADINLGDKESENKPDIIFYPIGYWNNEGTYERKPLEERTTAVESGFYTFEGTFDGNGHTISNFYQNTWEMKGDHNWYDPIKEQYYRDGMGLFGKIYKGTVKNLTVKNFSSDGEIATTGVIASYAEGSTFENIAIFNCNPRVYNIGNGGIVGCVGWYAKEAGLITTFKNITVDNTNKISALWGSYDVPCGGILGQYYPTSGQTSAGTLANGGLYFENCHVSAQLDVYNDVCANYQYYAYRYAGMLIGSVRENVTIDGHSYPKMDNIEAKNCTVHFGTWNDYYYCEIIDNTTASYTHDYQMSRLVEIKAIDGTTITYLDGTTGTVPASGRANYVIVDYSKGHGTENATCYHFKDGQVWNHEDAGTETVNGVEVLVEDKQHLYLEFNNLVTGYGWGVTTKGVGDVEGVKILDRADPSSVAKFKGEVDTLENTKIYTLGEIFSFVDNGVELKPDALSVSVHNLNENNPVSAIIVYDRENWANGTITFTGVGKVNITIQDYYFCTPTTIEVTITERQPEEKFDVVMNNGDFLHRVGNSGTVALDKLFKAKDGVTVGTISVTVEAVNGTSASGTYSNNAIQFNGTGVVKVTITDNDYCIPTVLYLEVVEATNVTGLSGTISGNVVLLNDCGLSSLTVSGRNTVYGNGFTATYSGNGQYLNNGLKQGVVNVSENGTLDNLRIVAPVYPKAYIYYGSTQLGDYVQGGPSSKEGDKTRYHYQLSAVTATGNAIISNCYIYGGRTNIFVNDGDVTIKDTVLECGTVANIQIQSDNTHTITLENLTTIQYLVDSNVPNTTSTKMLGVAIMVGPETDTNPTIILNGELKQYNWVQESDKNNISNPVAEKIISAAVGETKYNHNIGGNTYSNLGIIFMNNYGTKIEDHTGLPYELGSISMTGANGQVYSLQNASDKQIYFDYANADKSTANGWYQPQFKYPADLGGQYIEDDGGDEFLYREGDTIKVMFPSGDSKEFDLVSLVNIAKYTGQNLSLVVTLKDANGKDITVNNGKVKLSNAGTYTITYKVTDTVFYDKDGNTVTGSKEYSWNVTIDIALKETSIPNAEFVFNSNDQQIFRSGNSSIVQFIPFLSGLKIYDYDVNGNKYLRFDGGNTSSTTDYNKIAKATINNVNTTGEGQGYHIVTIEFTDGGKLVIDMDVRANSGSSTHSGSIKVRNNVLYVVNGGTTSGKGQTWKIYSYKFVGNNGTEINSGLVTFGTSGTDCATATKPSSNFGTTVKYTVNYDANGGKCGQNVGYATSVATAVTLPTPTRSGCTFLGWYTQVSGGTRVGGAGDPYTPNANITLYAQWGKIGSVVTYDTNDGNNASSEKYDGTSLTLPTPTRDGYWFLGWYDAVEGGKKIGDAGSSYNPVGNITLYAHWQEAIEYTVTYNANGGSCGTASATYQGIELTLPTPSRTGYTFNGWYTAASGGTKIGNAGEPYVPSANITVYAQWEINSYTITVTTSNATVKVNGTTVNNNGTISIQYGAQVTVEVTYSKSDSRSTTIKGADGTTYTSPFTMPAQNVTINATSKDSCVTADTLVMLADGTQKRIDEVTTDDMLLVWNFYTGDYDAVPAAIIFYHDDDLYEVIKLYFEDGTVVNVIENHGFYDVELDKFIFLDETNADEYIGHKFVKVDGDGRTSVALVGYEVVQEYTGCYSIQTAVHINFIVEGMFSLTIPPMEGWFDYFEIGDDMKYDEEKMQADIEKYGLYEYEVFAEYGVTYEQFIAFNGPYLKILVGRGVLTFEEILELISQYVVTG